MQIVVYKFSGISSNLLSFVCYSFYVFRNVGRGRKAAYQWWADTDTGWEDTWWADTRWADTFWADTWWADTDTGPGRTQKQAMRGADRAHTDCLNLTVNYLFL